MFLYLLFLGIMQWRIVGMQLLVVLIISLYTTSYSWWKQRACSILTMIGNKPIVILIQMSKHNNDYVMTYCLVQKLYHEHSSYWLKYFKAGNKFRPGFQSAKASCFLPQPTKQWGVQVRLWPCQEFMFTQILIKLTRKVPEAVPEQHARYKIYRFVGQMRIGMPGYLGYSTHFGKEREIPHLWPCYKSVSNNEMVTEWCLPIKLQLLYCLATFQ